MAKKETQSIRLSVPLIFLLLLFFFPAALWFAYEKNREITEKNTIRSAESFASSVAAYRTFYSRTIVKKIGAIAAIKVIHNHETDPSSIPLPATFAKDFGKFYSQRSGYKVNLYSDLPFPWREKEQSLDDFEQKAMVHLRRDATMPVWRFEETEKGQVLRYARADVLSESCVGCHNSYPGTPKTDWKVGDVRGVLSVTVPAVERSLVAWMKQFGVLLGIISLAALLLVVALRSLRKALHRERNALSISKQAQEHLQTEVSERNEVAADLQTTVAKSRSVFNSMGDALMVIDNKGIVTETNQAIEPLLGYTPEELVGENVKKIVEPKHRDQHDQYLENYQSTGDHKILGRVRVVNAQHKDGHLVPIELSVNVAETPDGRMYTGIIHDITDRIESEKEIAKAHQAALESAQVKAQFLANMSHEIRTPMNGIIGMAQLMSETKLSEEQQVLMNTINASTKSLLRIVNDVLDFSKIESGTYKIESNWFSLVELIEEVVTLSSEQAFDKNIELSFITSGDQAQQIYADHDRVRQILVNLVHNAIKFTDYGHVLLRLHTRFVSAENAEVEVSIEDTGIGIPPDQIDKLFDSFSQVDGTKTRRHDGSGLGLAISKSLAQLMQGDILVRSEVGQGSVFSLHLPLRYRGQYLLPKAYEKITAVLLAGDNDLSQIYCKRMAEIGMVGNTRVGDFAAAKKAQADFVSIDVDYVLKQGISEATLISETQALLQNTPCKLALYANPRVISVLGEKFGEHDRLALINTPILPSHILSSLTLLGLVDNSEALSAPEENAAGEKQRRVNVSHSILVVEDNKVNSLVASRMLDKCGYQKVTLVENGALAVAMLEKQDFDLVLMDCQMPVMDGFEATRNIRVLDKEKNRHTQIVALTANALESDKHACLAAGMDDYLAKPIDYVALKQVLEKWLGDIC